ncbi:MAG TPA: cupin domain-containing protein [Isosphaeraceae bacterium]|nr:cupin domain-containing protein [Isosphaeraceae bacterium]
MMNDLEVQLGLNSHCAHLGTLAGLSRFSFQHPALARPVQGKLFLKAPLGLTGAEVSLNVMPPGRAIPFLHKHKQNEELYIFIKGRGQVQVDGEVIDVAEGTVIRMSPTAVRSWRNHSDQDLIYIVVQYRADSHVGSTTSDGEGVPGEPRWPDHRAE